MLTRLQTLERENREPRPAREILRKASAYLAYAEFAGRAKASLRSSMRSSMNSGSRRPVRWSGVDHAVNMLQEQGKGCGLGLRELGLRGVVRRGPRGDDETGGDAALPGGSGQPGIRGNAHQCPVGAGSDVRGDLAGVHLRRVRH